MKPVLTTVALKEAELKTSASTEFPDPKAKLLSITPESTINTRGGTRTAQTFLSTHSLLIIISDEKPKRMLAIESRLLMKSSGTSVDDGTRFIK